MSEKDNIKLKTDTLSQGKVILHRGYMSKEKERLLLSQHQKNH